MENYWSPKGRIQAWTWAHRDATRSSWDHENATKRVANVSLNLPGPRSPLHCSRPVLDDRFSSCVGIAVDTSGAAAKPG